MQQYPCLFQELGRAAVLRFRLSLHLPYGRGVTEFVNKTELKPCKASLSRLDSLGRTGPGIEF
jgi:hypothetical protein